MHTSRVCTNRTPAAAFCQSSKCCHIVFRFIPCYFSLHIERASCSAPCPKKCRLKRVFRKNRISFGSCFVKINYSGKFLKFPRLRQCRCHYSDIIVINPSELAERQGIRAASGFNSVSRAIIKQDEPILVPGKAALRRHLVQFIAADGSKRGSPARKEAQRRQNRAVRAKPSLEHISFPLPYPSPPGS